MKKEKTICVFGSKILKNPEVINTDKMIGQGNFQVDELLSNKMFSQMEMGKTFLKVCETDNLQNYLKLILEPCSP